MSTVFVGDCDFTKVHFDPPVMKDQKQSVQIFMDSPHKTKIKFNVCSDMDDPVDAPFPLDTVREDGGNPNRRGMLVRIKDPRAIESLQKLDEAIIEAAVKNSKEWFKKVLTKEMVEMRYKPILNKNEETGDCSMKFKVKVGESAWPTTMHLRGADGVVRKHAVRLEDLLSKNKKLVPIVSAYSVWFMRSDFGLSFQAENMIVTPGDEEDELSMFASKNPPKVAKTEPPVEDTVTLEGSETVKVELDGEVGESAM